MKDRKEFYTMLGDLDGKPFADYKEIIGDFDFSRYVIKCTQMDLSEDADAPVVDKRTAATLGCEQLIRDRVVDHAGNDIVTALKADRNGDMRNAVDEIGRTVDRIDDPAMLAIAAVDAA